MSLIMVNMMNDKTVSAAEMKELDRRTIEIMGVPSMVLMERAALASVCALKEMGFDLSRVVCLCGAGNNGGDGIAVARLLHISGINAEILFVGDSEKCSAETARQKIIAVNYGVHVTKNDTAPLFKATTIVDALFGIGGSRPLEGNFRDAVLAASEARERGAKVLALDIPSGISADTGEILGCAIKADATVTFAFLKAGLTKGPGRAYAGVITVKDIGITD